MKQHSAVSAAKCVALAAVDIATFFLLFSGYIRSDLAVFPFVVLHVVGNLIILNTIILLSSLIQKVVKSMTYTALVMLTTGYMICSVLFTLLFHSWISASWYVGISSAGFVAYLLIIGGFSIMHRSGTHKGRLRETEKADMEAVQMALMEMESMLPVLQPQINAHLYDGLYKAFFSLRQSVAFSTPFGRSSKPVVMDMEKRIADRIGVMCTRLKAVCTPGPHAVEDTVQSVLSSMLDTAELIKNKEKLLMS